MSLHDTDAVIEMLRRGEYGPSAISAMTLIEVLRGLSAVSEMTYFQGVTFIFFRIANFVMKR
jgi:hypothetical protein